MPRNIFAVSLRVFHIYHIQFCISTGWARSAHIWYEVLLLRIDSLPFSSHNKYKKVYEMNEKQN